MLIIILRVASLQTVESIVLHHLIVINNATLGRTGSVQCVSVAAESTVSVCSIVKPESTIVKSELRIKDLGLGC